MAAGIPLTDADRGPWLDRLAGLLPEAPIVLACSALKRRYRDRLRAGCPDLRYVFLTAPEPVLAARMTARRDHYMPPSLLRSQLDALEPPEPDEGILTLDCRETPDTLVAAAAAAWRTFDPPARGAGAVLWRALPAFAAACIASKHCGVSDRGIAKRRQRETIAPPRSYWQRLQNGRTEVVGTFPTSRPSRHHRLIGAISSSKMTNGQSTASASRRKPTSVARRRAARSAISLRGTRTGPCTLPRPPVAILCGRVGWASGWISSPVPQTRPALEICPGALKKK